MKFFFLLLLSTIYFSIQAIAQSDTTDLGVDTIYIKGDPVVIKSEFYLSEVKLKDSSDWIISGGFAAGKNFSPLNGINLKMYSRGYIHYFIEAGKAYKQWQFTAGLSYFGSHGSLQYYTKHQFQREEKLTKIDTIDIYDQIVKGVSTRYYVTEKTDTVITHQEVKDTTLHYAYQQEYLTIPIRVGYVFKKNRWFISPSISLCPGFSLNSTSIVSADDNFKPRKFLILGSAQVESGRYISKTVSIGIYVQCFKNISPVLQQSSKLGILLVSGGFKINFYL